MTATLWHENTSGLSNYELACMSDELLLRLQVYTLAVPAYQRTGEDRNLLDRIGRHWQARKSSGVTANSSPSFSLASQAETPIAR